MNSHRDAIVSYYEGTRWDYRHLWRSEKAGALHFGYYDSETWGHVASLRRMTDFVASTVGVGPGDQVVDAGCGLGGCAIHLAQQAGCEVTGVNVTPFQVEAARESARRARVEDKVRFVEADFTDTHLPDSSYSVAWALESIVHTAAKDAFVGEARRLLVAGGRLVIAEYLLRESPPLTKQEAQDVDVWLSGWEMPSLLSENEYRALLERHGFEHIEVLDISRNVAPSLRRLGRLLRLFGPTAPALQRVRYLRPVRAANMSASAAQIRAFDSGAWSYKVLTARAPA